MNMDPSDTDPDIALEIALQNLGGSDSEAEETEATEIETERSEGPPGNLLEEEGEGSSELTRERMARMYSPSPAPSNAPSAISDGANSQLRQQQPVTLDTIIEDGGLFNLFRRFLKDQCTTRNLNFWLACEHYRKLKPSEGHQHLYEVARALYVKFIKASATQRVTLLDQTKKQIKMGLELKQRVTPDLFLTAQKEIWGVMNKNELRQFLVSGVLADCPGFANLADSVSLATSVYTPSMANPALGVCGGGSLQHSGSEDSASVSSFSTESDMGPRSSFVMQLSRPFPSQRNAISDCEDPKPRSSHNRRGDRHHSAYVTKDKPVTEERFAALVQDRLAAVIKDREAMTKKVRERARQQKKNYEEIMALEWYDLPEAVKYVQYEEPGTMGTQESSGQLQVPFVKPATSPLSTPRKDLNHLNGLALREVQAALKDMEITNQVSEARRPFSRSACSSVLSTTSDSGVGDTLGNSGLVTPKQDRLAAYVYHQNSLSDRTSEREREARAAAMSLIHASPQPESLNPRVPPMRPHPSSERHSRRPYSNYPEAYSSDDSSSCFTMTSHSSASDLFIPRRVPHRPAYSDNDESHHFGGPRYHRRPMAQRPLAQPRRSKQQMERPSQMAPSPIVEHQQLASPASSMNSTTPMKDKGHSGQTLVVYHLDQIPTPFAMRIPGTDITLRDFKDKVLKRPGSFRFFFKSYLEDVGEFLEECSLDDFVLPLFQGKIIGRVERID